MDHAPASFLAQKGPPGWTRNTSSAEFRRRYIRRPALRLGMFRSGVMSAHVRVRPPVYRVLIFALMVGAVHIPLRAACASALCMAVAAGKLPADYKAEIRQFYEPTNYSLAWLRGGTATAQALALIEVLKDADAKGLNAEDYELRHSETDVVEFDLELTVSAMRYISDLRFGRANPGLFAAEKQSFNLADFVRQQLVDARDVKGALQGIEPPYEGYRRTQQALLRYMAMAREDSGGPLPVTKKTVEPGSSYEGAARLADLLWRLGDLPADAAMPGDSKRYQGALVDAVKRFQLRHGLDTDGRLGKATFRQLNTPLSRRVEQLRLTLERWRWVPHSFPRPPIVVNIPGFVLRAANDSYQTELAMKVVVGKAYGHQTPVFAAEMNQVVFRPYWNVPLSIQRAELVPKIAGDAGYLARNHFEVVTPRDTVVSKGVVDRTMLEQLRTGKLQMRQVPGPENSLGLVAFRFPNEYDVYLHGTPAATLFSKSRRDFSHGCIRAQKPQELAEWVLRNQSGWTPERIAEAMQGTKTVSVKLSQPIPVLIVYATAVVLENGEVRFFEDIYGQDAKLEEMLEKSTSGARGPRPRE